MVSARTFDELRGADSDWCTTLAYWLGPYGGKLDAEAILGVGAAMSFQYDVEEQAEAYGGALPEEASWTKVFAPVAPVQLTRGWSPLPCAVALLGEPRVEAVEGGDDIRRVAAVWDAGKVSDIKSTARPSTNADEKRFLSLLTVSVTRAQQTRRGVIIAAKPGWSYEHVHGISQATARLMSKAGFVVTTRKP
jgi:hypothetical protein